MANYNFDKQVYTNDEVDLVEELTGSRKLIVHNDEVNTFDHVIESLVEICGHNELQAEQCSLIIHFRGQASVREGLFEKLHPMKEGLTDRGISATIE